MTPAPDGAHEVPDALRSSPLLIADELMLLLLPPDGRRTPQLSDVGYPLAGAVLIELALQRRITITRERRQSLMSTITEDVVRAAGPMTRGDGSDGSGSDSAGCGVPDLHPILVSALGFIGEYSLEFGTLLDVITEQIESFVLRSLEWRGILAHTTTAEGWFRTRTDWPERTTDDEDATRARISAAVAGRKPPNAATAAVISLLALSRSAGELDPPLLTHADASAFASWIGSHRRTPELRAIAQVLDLMEEASNAAAKRTRRVLSHRLFSPW